MKIDRLETHDRLQHFKKQSFDISECCQDIVNQRPFGEHPFYIFAHPRTDDDGSTKRLIWQPRLTKPKAQTNSMLFKAYPMNDNIKVIWIIPPRETWPQFEKGKVTESSHIYQSIQAFINNKESLEAREDDDLDDDKIDAIYKNLSRSAKVKKAGLIIPQSMIT
jgi:hypothetical protein